jgi:leucine dehydrogenase
MTHVFADLENLGHEQVVFFQDKDSGLKTIIGVHSTVLGPSLGGCRMWNYASENEAIFDVLRLSKGMTYKAAIAGLKLGGGKAVIIGDSRTQKTEKLLKAFGRCVESLGGKYITAEDVGMSVEDIDIMRTQTRFAVGGSNEGGSGDPSLMTAFGVFQGMKAAIKFANLGEDLKGMRIAIQGIGHVGYHLASYLHAAGAKLIVSDIYPNQLEKVAHEFAAQIVSPEDIYKVDCEVFSPCALGAILNTKTIPMLKCKVVAGCANNQLEKDDDGLALMAKNIVYAPDYAINSGGLINVAAELDGYNKELVLGKVSQVYNTISSILSLSKRDNIQPQLAAAKIAEERLQKKPENTGMNFNPVFASANIASTV